MNIASATILGLRAKQSEQCTLQIIDRHNRLLSPLPPNRVIPCENPFVGGEGLQADGTTRVEFLGGDGDLPSQPKLSTVGEAGAGVDVDGGGIDFVDKALGVGGVVGEDAIRVLGGVQVDVVDSLVEIIHNAHTQYQTEPFLVEVAILGGENTALGIAGEDLQGVVIATQLDVVGLEVGGEFWEEVGGDSAVHEEGIKGVANGGALDFGVLDDGEGFFLVGALVDEEVTDADATGHDGHGGVGFAEVL